ncbi:MAG: hypothetical protein A2015_13700 [Spirochaetes bacterium GWF1_31_7]|nr:MAG: hypothetical protein A2Y30_11125 [Spirochaetes bacterium GWE1_32_154]OHD47708.1 MAG: hypothetical protein A2Y29_05095 [Spirochaetes bacterium GWE2_31_10]OHD49873.1 MAG: hypothetical protein A2015_13700 [Spirochaetes bacterium GWF1_31_7]HBD92878.1 hypothetical protein [Spirochaetia bacterium]HBI37755.1 hypothetical protein [Spirochaetia bacterium]
MNKEEKEKYFGKAIPQIIHDIRNPLNIIIGFSSILQIDESINEEVRSYIKNIILSGMHIEQLLSNIDYFMMDTLDMPIESVFIKKEYEIFIKQNFDIINDKQIIINNNLKDDTILKLPQGIFTRILDNFFQFSLKGMKSVTNRQINIDLFINDKALLFYYHDTSTPIYIESDYFSFDEILKGKRSLAPMFIEKLIKEYNGTIHYLYGKKWAAELDVIQSNIKTQHGFKIIIPIQSL